MSKWDMVTYASRKVGKSLILQGQILKDLNFIHSVGEAIGKFLVGLKWSCLCGVFLLLLLLVVVFNHCDCYKGIMT